MERIYHPYDKWEDFKLGFYDNCSGEIKKSKIESVQMLFNSEKLTHEYMSKVINEWKYSCEHNLSNPSMNKIAYIGQGACCIYDSVPSTITMEAWNTLSKDIQDRSNKIAEIYLNEFLKRYD